MDSLRSGPRHDAGVWTPTPMAGVSARAFTPESRFVGCYRNQLAELVEDMRQAGNFSGAIGLLDVDRARRLFCVVWITDRFDGAARAPAFTRGGQPVSPAFFRSFPGAFPGVPPLAFHLLWFPAGGSEDKFLANLDGRPMPFHLGRGRSVRELGARVLDRFRRPFPGWRPASPWFRMRKLLVSSSHLAFALSRRRESRERFAGCWLFVDRASQADDNAEHLYRWVAAHHPERNIYFALHPDSRDWNRLEREGFRLLDVTGREYACAQFHAAWMVTTNLNEYITRLRWRYWYPESLRFQLAFLQHGVTKDYNYRLGRMQMDLVITSAEREYASLAADPEYPYPFSGREIRLTGMPRHDALARKAREASSAPHVLAAPTWRENLAGMFRMNGTSGYDYSHSFRQSRFFREWLSVLKNGELSALAASRGGRVRLWLHPNLMQQREDFEREGVEVLSDGGAGIQDAIAEASLMLTDYSSLAFEAALAGKPILYFQFDRERFTSTDHSYLPGYFDYERDGFGEVAANGDELIRLALARLADGTVPGIYRDRVRRFFAFHDENNCRRVYDAIVEASRAVAT